MNGVHIEDSFFQNLSDDILGIILRKSQNLFQNLHINRRFRELSKSSTKLDLPSRNWNMSEINRIIQLFQGISEFTYNAASENEEISITPQLLLSFNQSFPCLTMLQIGNSTRLSNGIIEEILKALPNLKQLILINCSNNGESIKTSHKQEDIYRQYPNYSAVRRNTDMIELRLQRWMDQRQRINNAYIRNARRNIQQNNMHNNNEDEDDDEIDQELILEDGQQQIYTIGGNNLFFGNVPHIECVVI